MSSDQPHLAHHFANLDQQREVATLGMWTFLATEVLFFGAVLTAYAIYRSQAPYAEQFALMSEHLSWKLALANTVVLIGSSFSVVMALHAAKIGQKRGVQLFLGITLLLALTFLGIKFFEYHLDFEESLIPGYKFAPENWPAALPQGPGELFMTFYFVLTGLHALHMLVGIGILLWVLWEAYQGRFGPDHYTPIEVFGLYWHFVDIVWIFLFPLLYLIRH